MTTRVSRASNTSHQYCIHSDLKRVCTFSRRCSCYMMSNGCRRGAPGLTYIYLHPIVILRECRRVKVRQLQYDTWASIDGASCLVWPYSSSEGMQYCRTELFCKLIIFAIESFANIVHAHLSSIFLPTVMLTFSLCKISMFTVCIQTGQVVALEI